MADLTNDQIAAVLADIARVASVVFDGEWCNRIMTPRSMQWLASEPDPNNRFAIGDNIDFDAAVFEPAKKLLLRLQRLAPPGLDVQCILWTLVTGRPERATMLIFNGGPTRWPLRTDAHETAEPMRRVMETGEPVELPAGEGRVLSVLAPVRDSLQDVTGFIEVSAAAANT